MKISSPNQKLQVYLGSAKTTNDMNIVVSYDTINNHSGERISNTLTFLNTNGVTHVPLFISPLVGQTIELLECTIYNKDTATKDVFIEIVDGSTGYIIKKETGLAIGGTLGYTPNRGWG